MDEIMQSFWGGRIVSAAIIASRIKSACKALGDNGTEQRYIQTIRGREFRFIAKVATASAESSQVA